MNVRELPVSKRYIKRQFRKNIRGNIFRGIVELLTNSYESYKRLEKISNLQLEKKIHLIVRNPRDGNKNKKLIVIDNAEGMDDKKLKDIIEYGKATSGILEGMPSRGYFGVGLKDACYALGYGEIVTKHNGKWYYAKFFYDEQGIPMVEGPLDYKIGIGDDTDIPKGSNGTRIRITINSNIKIQGYKNFTDKILNNVCLRDILSDKNCRVTLHYNNNKKKLKWTCRWKNIETKLDKKIYLSYNENKIPVDVKIYKADRDLDWKSNLDSERGLIIRSENSIHEITLFNRQSHMSLRRINGIIKIPYLDTLLRNEEEIITQSRDGLDWKHPFCNKLEEILIKILDEIDLEEQRKINGYSNVDDLTRKNLKDLAIIFRDIFNDELEKDELPEVRKRIGLTSPIKELPFFGFTKNKIKIYKNKLIKLDFYAKITKDLKINDIINFQFNKDLLEVIPEYTEIIKKKIQKGYFKTSIKLTGKNVGKAEIYATSGAYNSIIEIIINDLSKVDFEFERNLIKIPIGSSKRARLLVDILKFNKETSIDLKSFNPRITIYPNKKPLEEFENLYENQYFYDFEVFASDLCNENEGGIIQAATKNTKTEIEVICFEQDKNQGFFKPDINTEEPNPELPVELNLLFGKIIVFARHKTVYGFWKDDLKKIHSTNFKVRLADLFIDKLIDVLISRKFEKSTDLRFKDIENEKRMLYKKYAQKIYKCLRLL